MRVCLVLFVCAVLVVSAIARPGRGGKRARRNQPVYEDEIDDREPREQSHQQYFDDFFNVKSIRQNHGVRKNVAKSSESDEQVERKNPESDEDDFFEDSEEEDQDGQSEEETGGYEDEIDNHISRGQSEGRKRESSPYVPKDQQPEMYVDIDDDLFETGRRPTGVFDPPAGNPRQYVKYDKGIRRNRESRVQAQGTQPRSGECVIYCSGPKISGSADAQIRSMCGCGDYRMEYKE